jgi:hypothetical protein
MTTPPVSPPYQGTVGASAREMAGFERVANSDPRKVARIVLSVAELDDPRLRLLVGSDAYDYGREAWQHRIETDEKSEALSRSADHDEAAGAWERQPRQQSPPPGRLTGATRTTNPTLRLLPTTAGTSAPLIGAAVRRPEWD